MARIKKPLTLALLILVGALRADGADEAAMFGAAASASPTAQPDVFATDASADNPLQIGGIFYQQVIASPRESVSEGETPLSFPLQLDMFADARPNDRLRTYLAARLLYNSSGVSGSTLPSASGPAAAPSNPQVVLDQAWLKFDMAHTVFVTAGKQHVKWGASRIWNPSDQLNPSHRDPLQPYDLRLGSSMLKFDLPLGSVKGNLSAMALLDNPVPAATLNQVGGAFRAEAVLGGAEWGLDVATRSGLAPAYGADVSAPLGPFDAYAEAALLSGDHSLYHFKGMPAANADISTAYSIEGLEGHALQASAGLNTTFAWAANRQATVGAEYFYNELGADNPALYPVLLYLGKYQPFYTGRQYAALYLSAEGPDESKHTSYSFSTIGNITDASFVSRLDFNWLLLEHLSFGAYADGHYGLRGGEFNFKLDTPALTYQGNSISAQHIPIAPFDLGMSLRLSF